MAIPNIETLPTEPLSPILHNWTQINLNAKETVVQTQIKDLIRDVPCPWKTVSLISPAVEIMVMDVLQQELDANLLRVFIPEKAREKLLRDFCQEALIWRQLCHPNILPFLGVSEDLFATSYCLISPWMINENIMCYLEVHPDHDRLTSLVQVAEGMQYLHNHDPPIVHADIRGVR
ncbi:hypothetical protein EDD85DRAFT_945746 [Armillaria nabsnona]|nr:hypothetical protein EDD85DRAFT_945746 [Armillaria nabsnona]